MKTTTRTVAALGAVLLTLSVLVAPAAAQARPEGELRVAMYVTIAPAWFDPGEVTGFITPFWLMWAMHDALVKTMPGKAMAPSLAESWTVSPDGKTYDFKLRAGLKFHNGDPFTAEDVKFSFNRAKGYKILKEKVRDIEIAGPARVKFHLHEAWPDFMTFYGTMVAGHGWIVPKAYTEKVGDDGFKKAPVGLGPYKFVSHQPGIELVLEANESYWRKAPSVKRLVFRSVPESSTRLAMLKRGETDIAFLLDVPHAQEVRKDPSLKLAFSGGIATFYLDFFDMWDPKSPWANVKVRQAASLAIDRKTLNEAETLGQSRPTGGFVPRNLDFALAMEPDPYDPARAKKLLAEAGYPNGFDAGELHPFPPYFSMGESVAQYLQAVGIRTRLRTMERAAFMSEWQNKKLKGVCFCITGVHGNAATRLSQYVPSEGSYAYGGWPDVDALFRQQGRELDRKKREAMLHQLQKTIMERYRFAMVFDYVWPSGIGPRVGNPALLLIDPYPWSAPYEELTLKK
ncbi:MAG: ABC transporter substrate-binding protein [Candidatus Rokubacteria bacterium]|nr:ABC transporter substrate-binding protein [Candidatus Rokubacteria bacterium]